MEKTIEQVKCEKKKIKQVQGITLIALVITIIVLLILAGVSIATLTGENGILTRANDAKENTEQATAREKVEVEVLGSYGKNGKLDLDRLKENIQNSGGTVIGDSFPVTVTMDGYDFSVDAEGNVILIGKNNGDLVAGGEWNGKVNTPKLAKGMIPIKWDDSQTKWVICSEHDPEWYNYIDQSNGLDGTSKWANVMLSDGKYYAQNSNNVNTQGKVAATIGQVVEETDLGSMFVWIPRYAYEIDSLYHTSSSNSGGIIKIAFLEGTKTYNSGDTVEYSHQGERGTATLTNASGQGNWNEHPAFNYGGTIIPGVWVAKFEASSTTDTPDTNYGGEDVTNLNVKILPGKQSWRQIGVGNCYTNCVNMNNSENASYYGISQDDNKIDPHLMKNSEWGVVAYLTQSSYGRNQHEVTPNAYGYDSNKYIYTGYAGDGTSSGNEETLASKPTNVYYYDTDKGMLASTTGNETGIYDLSGGAWERVAAYINNNHEYLKLIGQSLLDAPAKHKDVYELQGADTSENNFNNMSDIFGNAMWETSSDYNDIRNAWYDDARYSPAGSTPFFPRGGGYWSYELSGVFSVSTTYGGEAVNASFRPTIVVY